MPWRLALVASLNALAACLCACGVRAAPVVVPVDYNRDIRPILSDRCYACHGPDEGKRKAGLRLDRREDALALLASGGRALVPGDPSHSALVERVTTADESRRMPPRRAGTRLTSAEAAVLRRWVEQGGPWKKHWAYLPPTRPVQPAVRNRAWPRNAIDAFVLARLEKEGLTPAPEADRATLLRRVSMDLTGLPPTPADVEAFLADRRPDAYEQAVDRLLASPHYGERMAQAWLDLARYADTNGYHIDNHRDMWKWRDVVIDAFNRNQRFDQFTIEQLAGDLLPRATQAQRVATGFHRNVMVNFEGGADPDEYLTKYIVDRVDTTATVWLGTTLACAECHDHKYDPFTQKEFYQLYAFFHNVPEKGLDGQEENPVPSLKFPTPEQAARLADCRRRLDQLDARIQAELVKVKLAPPVRGHGAMPDDPPRDFVWVDDELPDGADPGGEEGPKSWNWIEALAGPVHSGTRAIRRTARGRSQQFFTGTSEVVQVGPGDALFAYVYLDPANPPKTIMLQFHSGGWHHRAYWGEDRIDWGSDGTSSRLGKGPLPPRGRWVRLEVSAQAVGLAPGSRVDGLALTQFGGTVTWDQAGIRTRLPQGAPGFACPEDWERAVRADMAGNVPTQVRDTFKIPLARRTATQTKELRDYFVSHAYLPAREVFRPLNREHERFKREEAKLQRAVASTMVMQEMGKSRDTFVLLRGDFQRKSEKVRPDVPAMLPPLPRGTTRDRLALARWLVDPGNPLTARVTVNRSWQQLFGTGLVKTSDDFGSQGEWPSHPEMLDWLATELVARGWDMKAIQRLIVTSATYRQSSRAAPERYRLDPENRLLSRGPRFRLDAETVRDNALAVAGLLDGRIGGPSVRPPQPPGLWEAVSFGSGFSSQTYEPSKGRDRYRRSLYTYWKRSMPYPSLAAFDAPSREVCCSRRPRTNTPLQALVLLNDPAYVEAARALGQRALAEGGANTAARLTYAFKLCTARAPTAGELTLLTRVYEEQRARFAKDSLAARQLAGVGDAARPAGVDPAELAAWTAVGNVLLNLDETVTKS